MKNPTETFEQRNKQANLAGGESRVKRHKSKGKMTARERLGVLLDEGSFEELGRFVRHNCHDFGMAEKRYDTDGVITGMGRIHGRLVAVFSQDATIFGGSLGQRHAAKICQIMDLAAQEGCPVIGLNDSGGARIQEGVMSLGGYADIFLKNTLYSGVVPQISAVMGPCAGGAVYSPAITDFIFMTDKQSYMFVTGPDVVKTVTHEEIDKEGLGGAQVHASKSGVVHFVHSTEDDTLKSIRRLLSYFPSNNMEAPPVSPNPDPVDRDLSLLDTFIPSQPNKPYDMHELIGHVVDQGSFFEVQRAFAANIVVGFARIAGQPIGVVANQPSHLAGCLDIDASTKAARFIRFCDCFNIPLVTFVDVPGFLPGVQQEHSGIIRNGAKLLFAFAEATVPKITVITRKAYGGAYDVMSSKHIRGDINFAFPSAEIAVMGPEGAVKIIFKDDIAKAKEASSKEQELTDQYREKFANPYIAAEMGYIDEIIMPSQTRMKIEAWLKILANKRRHNPNKKHGNIPL